MPSTSTAASSPVSQATPSRRSSPPAMVPTERASIEQAVCAQALLAAWSIRTHLTDSPSQATRFGEFTFSGKVCAAWGPVDWAIWQDTSKTERSQRAASVFGGDGLAETMAIDPHADAGQIVITNALARDLPEGLLTTTSVADYRRVDTLDAQRLQATTPVHSPSPMSKDRHQATAFYPGWLLNSTLQGEFRQVVTLFVNFEQRFGPLELADFQEALFRLVDQYDGFLDRVGQIGGKDNGNTLLLFWGAPTGSEQDVERALSFILDLQNLAPTRLRAGVTTRMAYAGFVGSAHAEEYTCYGSYVNLAARQLVASGWGEIWIDDETARQAARRFQTERRGVLRFKGFVDPQPVFLLTGRQTREAQTLYAGALVGRQAEIAELRAGIDPIFSGNFAGLVAVEGEAGLGKSRLVHEFQLQTETMAQNPRWFLCQTDDILRRPLNPFRYWLRRYFRQSGDASDQANRVAFDAVLDDLCQSIPEDQSAIGLVDGLSRSRSFLAALVDLYWAGSLYEQLDPQLRLENMLDALKTLIKAESLVQPAILLLEDAHWLDDESRQFIDQLTRNVDDFPFALIATQRPGDESDNLVADDVPQTRVQLSGLSESQIGPIAATLLGSPPSANLAALITTRTNGNPFFVEQIVLYLQEHDMLEPGEQGLQLKVSGQADSEQPETTLLPTDVRALLTARLDQLHPTIKEVVQTASVLGREFDRRVLSVMLNESSGEVLDRQMDEAGRARIWSAMSEARYLFRHALLRDAAYDMQLRSRLRRLHRSAAGAVRSVYAGEPARHYAELVHHYHQGEVREEEKTFADLAGEYASEQFANEEALRFFERAIELADENDWKSISDLLMKHEDVAYTSGNRAVQQSDLDQLSALATNANKSLQAEVLLRIGNHARVLTDYEHAIGALKSAIELSQEIGDIDLNARVCNCLGKTYWRQNRYPEAEKELNRSLELASSSGSDALVADTLYHLGLIDYSQAEYGSAMTLFEAAHQQHVNDGNQKGITQCLSMFGAIHNNLGDYVAAQEDYDRGLEICRTIGWRHTEAHYLALIGNNDLDVGRYELASASHEKALALTRESGRPRGRCAEPGRSGPDRTRTKGFLASSQLLCAGNRRTGVDWRSVRSGLLTHPPWLHTDFDGRSR